MSAPESDLSKTRLRAWLALLKASSQIEKNLRERLRAEFDTTLPRFDVMAALYRSENGLKMSQLSRELKVSNGNVTGIIERLVGDGSVVRIAVSGDRRANLVQLTEQGRAKFSNYAAAHESWVDEILSSIDHNKAEDLIEMLSSISKQEDGA